MESVQNEEQESNIAQSLITDEETINDNHDIKSQTGSDYTQEISHTNNNTKIIKSPVVRKTGRFGKFYGKWKNGMSKSTHDLTIATTENQEFSQKIESSQVLTKTENSQVLDKELVYRFIIPLYGYLGQVVPDRSSVVFQTRNSGNLKLNWDLDCNSSYEMCYK